MTTWMTNAEFPATIFTLPGQMCVWQSADDRITADKSDDCVFGYDVLVSLLLSIFIFTHLSVRCVWKICMLRKKKVNDKCLTGESDSRRKHNLRTIRKVIEKNICYFLFFSFFDFFLKYQLYRQIPIHISRV